MAGRRCIFLDIEATSLDVETAKIIEIFALELMDGLPTGRSYYQLFDPEEPLVAKVEELTGLDNDQLKGKPKIREKAAEMRAFIAGEEKPESPTVIGGHNVHYDLSVLSNQLITCGQAPLRDVGYLSQLEHDRSRNFMTKFNETTIDTMRIVGRLAKVRHGTGNGVRPWLRGKVKKWPNLNESSEAFDVDAKCRDHHGAAVDTMLSIQVYLRSLGIAADDPVMQQVSDICMPFLRRRNITDRKEPEADDQAREVQKSPGKSSSVSSKLGSPYGATSVSLGSGNEIHSRRYDLHLSAVSDLLRLESLHRPISPPPLSKRKRESSSESVPQKRRRHSEAISREEFPDRS